MNEIKCPNCGKVFQVDEAGYASIVSQIRNALFEKEVADRISSVRRESAALQEKAAKEVVTRGLSVRQTETLAASLLRKGRTKEKEPPAVDYVREAERRLTDALGRSVKLTGGQKKGRISLAFYSADDREALMEALMKMDKPWKSGK